MDARAYLLASAMRFSSEGAAGAAAPFPPAHPAAGPEWANVGLDEMASNTPEAEPLFDGLFALFPFLDEDALTAITTFLASEGAKDRTSALLLLRTRAGEAVLARAAKLEPPLSLLHLAALEGMVQQAANPSEGHPTAQQEAVWSATPPMASAGLGKLPS